MVLKAVAKRLVKQSAARVGRLRLKHSKKKIAVVMSLFNEEISRGLLAGAARTLEENGYGPRDWQLVEVPGAFEIPLVALTAARSGRFTGVLTLGCVVRGATQHFEYVCLVASLGCLQAGLISGCPVAFGVLTTENEAQARERSSPDDFNKGREAALALLDVLKALEAVK